MKINQMKKDEFFEGFYLIKSAELRQTRAGKDFLALTFQDDTGEISGNIWDAQPGKIKDFVAGAVVHMQGRREVYNNMPQVNQITLRLPKNTANTTRSFILILRLRQTTMPFIQACLSIRQPWFG